MKKFSWIIALFAVLALMFVGCPGDGDNPGSGGGNGGTIETGKLTEIFPRTVSTASATISIKNDILTVTSGTSTTRLDADLLTAEGGFNASAYKGIKFEYKSNIQLNAGLQDGIDPNSMWLIVGWGHLVVTDQWTEITCRFGSDLEKAWGNSTAFNPSKFEKIWFGSDNPDKDTKFEMRNFAFIK